jgi:hypothetical protein
MRGQWENVARWATWKGTWGKIEKEKRGKVRTRKENGRRSVEWGD